MTDTQNEQRKLERKKNSRMKENNWENMKEIGNEIKEFGRKMRILGKKQ